VTWSSSNSEKTSTSVKKKKDLDLWCFHQLIECCVYLQQQSTTTTSSSDAITKQKANIVTLVYDQTNDHYADVKYREAFKLAKEKG
jgi:hypothetical protein